MGTSKGSTTRVIDSGELPSDSTPKQCFWGCGYTTLRTTRKFNALDQLVTVPECGYCAHDIELADSVRSV